jgi:hypothetical protein
MKDLLEEDPNAERDKTFRYLIKLLKTFSENPRAYTKLSQIKEEMNRLFSELVFALESFESASFVR